MNNILSNLRTVIFIFGSIVMNCCTTIKKSNIQKSEDNVQVTKYLFSSEYLVSNNNENKIHLGGYSGLHFKGINPINKSFQFITHTDRGPNLEAIEKNGKFYRPFLDSNFQPMIVEFEVSSPEEGSPKIELKATYSLFGKSNNKLTGLPRSSKIDEIPIDQNNRKLMYDKNGLDLESLAFLPNNTFWMGDEYGPSLVHFDSKFKEIERLNPSLIYDKSGVGLPNYYSERKMNRGFEGIAICENKLYAFLQSPLPNESTLGVMRILELDLKSQRVTGEYLYQLENKLVDKLGDAACIRSGEFLIIEQNSKVGKSSSHKLFKIDIKTATNLLSFKNKNVQNDKKIDSLLSDSNFELASHTEWLNLVDIGIDDIEKIEGLAILNQNTVAIIEDNDFGVTVNSKKNQSQFIIIKNFKRDL